MCNNYWIAQWGDSALHLALNKSKEEVFFYLIENFFDECNVNVGLGSTAIVRSNSPCEILCLVFN